VAVAIFPDMSRSDKQCVLVYLESPWLLLLHFLHDKDHEAGTACYLSIPGSYALDYEDRKGTAKVCRTILWELDILSGKSVWKTVGFLFTHMPL